MQDLSALEARLVMGENPAVLYAEYVTLSEPTTLNADQARLVAAFDVGNRTLLDPGDLADEDHLTSEATRTLLDGWDIRDEASK